MKSHHFKFKGRVHVWKYLENQKNFPGVHLAADRDGCDSMIELLSFMDTSDRKSIKTVNLYPTTQKVASVGMRKGKFRSVTALILTLIPEEDIWMIEDLPNDEIKISFAFSYLEKMRGALMKIKENDGDFFITDKNKKHTLWFWWYLSD